MLYVCGGYDGMVSNEFNVEQFSLFSFHFHSGENDLSTAECYNPLINEWKQITPMGTKRSW
jgi:hypothetical protein